jgi:hypothetical protein
MGTYTESRNQAAESLDECIHRAMSRVSVGKETDLCRYLPGSKGHMHHFAFGKLKKTSPGQLQKLLKEHVLEKDSPEPISSKPRTSLMVKRTIEVKFKRSQINRLVDILKNSGEDELIAMLSPHQSLGQVQKAMLDMIRSKEIDADLWATYVKLVEEERAVSV